MFGFAYKAANTHVKVSFIEKGDSNHVVVLDRFMEKVNGDESEGWHYFLKNLTHVDFLKNAWDSDSKVDWRVSSYILKNFSDKKLYTTIICPYEVIYLPKTQTQIQSQF